MFQYIFFTLQKDIIFSYSQQFNLMMFDVVIIIEPFKLLTGLLLTFCSKHF